MPRRQRFFIGPLSTGLQRNLKPWLIPDDAFERLNNAYLFRGRVRKRFGSYHIADGGSITRPLRSRLRVNLGSTDASGDISGTLSALSGITIPSSVYAVGQQFSIGEDIFTVSALGTPTTMLSTSAFATTTDFNTTTGLLDIQDADANTDCYWYPNLPVMGLPNYETDVINFEPLFAFDTRFAYQFTGGGWEPLGTEVWTGDNSNFFWATNYRGQNAYENYLYVSNFVTADGIRYWDGTAWSTLNPAFNSSGDTIETARIIIPFKDRLLLLNVVENIGGANRQFGNRCRFSQNGDPRSTDAWRQDLRGKGSFFDAPTSEQIVSAQLIRDRLIVFFERSSWEIVYTGNQINPFVWQQINSELGVESSFSTVQFDRVAIGVGNVGIHACTGASVERIDQKIPDEVFSIHETNNALNRVYGVRDYFSEQVYWTFPTQSDFAQKILAYNYSTGSWAFFDESYTCFGYYQPSTARTWAASPEPWYQLNDPWVDPQFNARFRSVVAGNQQGFVAVVDADKERNSQSLSLSNISGSPSVFTVVNHNLLNNQYVLLENLQGTASVTALNNTIYTVRVLSDSTLALFDSTGSRVTIGGTYDGGGYISRVSQIDILTKDYNFFLKEGVSVDVSKVDFYVEKTSSGAISVDVAPSSSFLSLVEDGTATQALLGNSVLETSAYALVPLESQQQRLWHPVYLQAEGESIQLRLYLSPEQMFDTDVSLSPFQLHAMIFHALPGSTRLD